MSILVISGYHFLSLTELSALRQAWLALTNELGLKGTILLSPEGININVAGYVDSVENFIGQIQADIRFAEMSFHRGKTAAMPFKYMKVKIKKEIITLRAPEIQPEVQQAPYISPEQLKQWLDEGQDMTLLDTRNDFEVRFGTFKNAVNLGMNFFTDIKNATQSLDPEKPIVMFCTGGIRCEKAALLLQQAGFNQVFQLHKGILNYFKQIGGAHYEGDCFVFDERVSVTPTMAVSGKKQCKVCQGPVTEACCG